MKMNKLFINLLFLGSCFLFSLHMQAQVKTLPDGRVVIGGGANAQAEPGYSLTSYGTGHYYSHMPDKNTFFQIDITPANPRLAGTGNQIVFYNTKTSTYNSIQVREVYTYSDLNAKANVKPLENSLDKIVRLTPVSYVWKNTSLRSEDSGIIKGAEEELGFLAQDVESVFPEAVITDSEGKKLVNYTALIPVLVEAMQVLKTEVEELKEENQQLKANLGNNYLDKGKKEDLFSCLVENGSTRCVLSYHIEGARGKALVQIANLYGKQIKTVDVNVNDRGISTININGLGTGIYFVSLIYQNQLIGTQKMIVSN